MANDTSAAVATADAPASRSNGLLIPVVLAVVAALIWGVVAIGYPLVIVLALIATATMLIGIVVVTATGL